jgi:hypothetical protein
VTSRLVLVLATVVSALSCNERAPDRASPSTIVVSRDSVAPTGAARLNLRLGPWMIEGARYTLEMERYLHGSDTAVRHVRVTNDSGRVVYEEEVAALLADGWQDESWIEVSANALEDAGGRPRGLELVYAFYPSAPTTGVSFRILAPREGGMKALTPMMTYAGEVDNLPAGSQPFSQRLLDGNRFVAELWRYSFAALVPLRVDLDCTPGSDRCVTIALPDSIGGLARFRVEATPRPIDATATIELFPAPNAAAAERVTIRPGSKVEILGGAGRVELNESDPPVVTIDASDDWLHVRIDGRTGWVQSEQTFNAIGLPSAG